MLTVAWGLNSYFAKTTSLFSLRQSIRLEPNEICFNIRQLSCTVIYVLLHYSLCNRKLGGRGGLEVRWLQYLIWHLINLGVCIILQFRSVVYFLKGYFTLLPFQRTEPSDGNTNCFKAKCIICNWHVLTLHLALQTI
jgi:hypothetical protein